MTHFGATGVVVLALEVVADAAVTVIPTLALRVSNPLVPVIERVKEPVEAEDEALTVSGDVALEPDGGVTGLVRLTETPEGAEPSQE